MDNGRNLIDMVCEAFESTEEEEHNQGGGGGGGDGGEEEAEPQACFNFSERLQCVLQLPGWIDGALCVCRRAIETMPAPCSHACPPAPTRRHLPRAAAAQARPAGVCRCRPRLWSQVCRGAVCGNP